VIYQPPQALSNRLQLEKGTLYKGGDLKFLQPWENRPVAHQTSDQKCVFARVTFQECLRFVHSHYKWIGGRHYVYYFLQDNPHHHLFHQFYLNGSVPHPNMKGDIAKFACAFAHVLPSGCIQVDRDDRGRVIATELLNDYY
jgi:hypothetical protein